MGNIVLSDKSQKNEQQGRWRKYETTYQVYTYFVYTSWCHPLFAKLHPDFWDSENETCCYDQKKYWPFPKNQVLLPGWHCCSFRGCFGHCCDRLLLFNTVRYKVVTRMDNNKIVQMRTVKLHKNGQHSSRSGAESNIVQAESVYRWYHRQTWGGASLRAFFTRLLYLVSSEFLKYVCDSAPSSSPTWPRYRSTSRFTNRNSSSEQPLVIIITITTSSSPIRRLDA